MKRRELLIVLFLFVAGLGLRYVMVQHWCFAGSDSYGYLKLSDELRQNGRLALGPKEPLQWARLPLYPIFLMVKGEGPTDPGWGGDYEKGFGWVRIMRAQAWVDMIFIALGAWWLTRRLVGPRAALWVMAFAVISPFTLFYVGAVLTETLAIALSTAALAPFFLWRNRPALAFAISGAMVGLAMLLRADSVLLMAAWPPALWFLSGSWRRRIEHLALAVGLWALVFHFWPVRNLHRFGAPHAIGARIDRESRPLEHVDGYWNWLRSFAMMWPPTTYTWTCYYERSAQCGDIIPELERLHAFDSPAEKARVERLLKQRARFGLTREVDAQFALLASERAHARPIWVHVVLPLLRAGNMWVSWYGEVISTEGWRPLSPYGDWVWEEMFPLTMLQFLMLIGALLVLLWRQETRWMAAIALGAMLTRTLVLGWTGYCMPRYALEMMPIGWVMIAAAIPQVTAWIRTRRGRPAPSS